MYTIWIPWSVARYNISFIHTYKIIRVIHGQMIPTVTMKLIVSTPTVSDYNWVLVDVSFDDVKQCLSVALVVRASCQKHNCNAECRRYIRVWKPSKLWLLRAFVGLISDCRRTRTVRCTAFQETNIRRKYRSWHEHHELLATLQCTCRLHSLTQSVAVQGERNWATALSGSHRADYRPSQLRLRNCISPHRPPVEGA